MVCKVVYNYPAGQAEGREPSSITVTRTKKSCSEHNHSLENIDAFKRPKALMQAAAAEVSKNYQYHEVATAIKAPNIPEAEQQLHDTGGLYFNRQDVKNAGRHWKKANPDIRQVGKSFPINIQELEALNWDEAKGRAGRERAATRSGSFQRRAEEVIGRCDGEEFAEEAQEVSEVCGIVGDIRWIMTIQMACSPYPSIYKSSCPGGGFQHTSGRFRWILGL